MRLATRAVPMYPDAPVTKTRMVTLLIEWRDV
jgi:hypothetical protein